MPISWDDAQTFLAVTEARSFSKAAKELGVGQPTVSRRIANLEARIGAQLFLRGRGGAELTDDAIDLVPAAQQMARWAGEFARGVAAHESAVSGIVRIAAPPGISVERLGPFARKVKELHPAIVLEVVSGVEHVDLTRGVADLAIRTKPSSEPELVVLQEATSRIGIYARKDYAATLPSPCSWSDVDWISWGHPFEAVAPRPMLEKLIPDFMPVFASDDYLVQKSALFSGLGAMIIGAVEAQGHTDSLVEIDLGVSLPASEFYLVGAKSSQTVPRIQTIARLLADEIDASGSASN